MRITWLKVRLICGKTDRLNLRDRLRDTLSRMSAKSKQEDQPSGPELVIGLVGAVGTDLDCVTEALSKSFKEVEYSCSEIKLSELLHQLDKFKNLPITSEYKRIKTHMNAGDELRAKTERADALALYAAEAIRVRRQEATGDANKPNQRHAYILRSLKHPAEVVALRQIYNSRFQLVSAYSPESVRKGNLATRIAQSLGETAEKKHEILALELTIRDEDEGDEYGQNVRDTFPLADVFIDSSVAAKVEGTVQRFVQLLFKHPFHTPTRDEYGMFHAHAAALRSASLSRQVGAVIAAKSGEIVSVGTNEVPKFGGGLYWPDDDPDERDFRWGYDTSDRMKANVLTDILKLLAEEEWLAEDVAKRPFDDLVNEALREGAKPFMKRAQVNRLIEFVRAVHAEMAAIMDAAWRGVSLKETLMYTTTFPCHDCAKHIIASGIQRVVYVEPYPKSLAAPLHKDSLSVDSPSESNKVSCEPFVGVAPRRYIDLFSMVKRKRKDGEIMAWDGAKATPKLVPPSLYYLVIEKAEAILFRKKLQEVGYLPLDKGKEKGNA